MNGLVSGYGSASDEEESTSVPNVQKITSENEWLECMDNTTGYPYYWNKRTNEVKWDRPAEMPSHPKIDKPAPNKESKFQDKKHQKKKSRSKSPPQVFIGPTLPQLTPEEIARQKVIKFEETMAKEIEKDVLKESPPDWKQVKPQKGLYSKPFAWKKTNTCLQTFKQLESTLKKASQSISLIAGVYGDEPDDDEDKKSPPKTKSKRTGVHVKVQKPASKQSKPLLKDIPGIFKEENENNDEDLVEDNAGDVDQNTSEDPPKKKRRWDIKDRSYINSTAEKICQKLEFLEVAKIPVSPLKLLAVQVETLFVAWQNGALSNTYLQTTLEKFAIKMAEIEQNTLAPPGWRVRWNRSMKKYAYENLITREVQFEPPSKSLTDDDDDDDDDDVNEEVIHVKESQIQKDPFNAEKQPPLPPQPPKDLEQPPLPPPPPEMSNPAPPPPEPQNQVEDMDLSDEESESIIETQNNGNNQDHLKDVLSSFYSDLATMDPGAGSKDTTPTHTPPQVNSPGPSFVQDQESSSQQSTLSDDRSNSPSAFGATGDPTDDKRKRKTKISSGLSMKKKNVGLLVTKWQNIQQEVKRNK